MTASELKTYAEIIEIAFKIAAIVVAGSWAIYGFVVFRQRQAALMSLRKAESEVIGLELAAKRRAVLDISFVNDSRRDLAGNGYVVAIQVVIANAGVAPAHMQFENNAPAIRVQRIAFDAEGSMTFPDEPALLHVRNAFDPAKPARARVIRAGGTSRLSTVLRVSAPGVYCVSFRALMDDGNREAMIEAGASPAREHHWSATSYLHVGFSDTGNGARENSYDSANQATTRAVSL